MSLSRREANLQKGRQLLREGKVSEARDCFTRCVNITPAMAHNLIKVKTSSYTERHSNAFGHLNPTDACVALSLFFSVTSFYCLWLHPAILNVVFLVFLNQAARARGVDCVVAPYEADAQLAYLTKSGLAQAVITEDSDLLAFGCKKVSHTKRSGCISSCRHICREETWWLCGEGRCFLTKANIGL